jgi:hypothetical protein
MDGTLACVRALFLGRQDHCSEILSRVVPKWCLRDGDRVEVGFLAMDGWHRRIEPKLGSSDERAQEPPE